MTQALWRIGSDTPDWEAHDLSGRGAERSGGRWNRRGRPVVYCSSSIALAALETLVHLDVADMPLNRYLVRIDVSDRLWRAREIRRHSELPVGWDARPEGKVSLGVGDEWLTGGRSALLEIPSVIVPEETNVLLNPRHVGATSITAVKLRAWQYDRRMRS